MTTPDPRMVEFIQEHHILTLAVSNNGVPWCATCFYVYLPAENRFVFTSDDETRHIRDVEESGHWLVAGAIALETRIVGKIRGIQFLGNLAALRGDAATPYRKAYLKRFPIARLAPRLSLWSLDPTLIKMTDNRLGFGKKLHWPATDDRKDSNEAG
jgi:uncharacterized protein YhbP (UPF0306 family)